MLTGIYRDSVGSTPTLSDTPQNQLEDMSNVEQDLRQNARVRQQLDSLKAHKPLFILLMTVIQLTVVFLELIVGGIADVALRARVTHSG